MSAPVDMLTTSLLRSELNKLGVAGLHVEVFDSLPSTSEYLSAKAKHLSADGLSQEPPQPQLCATDWQTKGNGRRGKTWVTERGNITFSMLVPIARPPAQLLGLSLVTGICVAESLSALAGLDVHLKWPNDVLVGDRKLCGLLTELLACEPSLTLVVVGIGINYKQPRQIESSDYRAVSVPDLLALPPSRAALISDVATRILREFSRFETQGWSAFAPRWDRFDYLKGRQVRVLAGNTEERALAVGVDEQGALLVEANGVTRAVFSGDVSLRLA